MTGHPEVVVHGGVHKTATSHIQAILQRNAGRLRKHGVHYVHHRDTRKDFTNLTQLNGYEKLGLDYRTKIPDAELARRARAFFDAIGAAPGERIVLSDENMAGHGGHCAPRGTLYSRRDTLIPIFARNIPYPVSEVHLSLRNYADFFASIFVEFLRSAAAENLITETQMKRAVLSRLPGWTGLIDLTLACFPQARLTVWRYEDFRALSDRVIANLCGPGVDIARFDSPQRDRGRPSASHRAVQQILLEAERDGAAAALARRVKIQETYPRGDLYPGYEPWSAAERAHMTRLYDRDLAEIATRERVTLLRPDPARGAS